MSNTSSRPKWSVLSVEAKSRIDSNIAQRLNTCCKSNEDATKLLLAWLDAAALPPNPDITISIQEIRG